MVAPAPGKPWNDFSRWCRSRSLVPMPAHPWTVAAYLRWSERRRKFPVIVESLKAIARRHLMRGYHPPDLDDMVISTLKRIELRSQGSFDRSALFSDTDFVAPETEVQEESAPQPQLKPKPKPKPKQQKKPLRSMRSMRSSPKLVTRRRLKD